MNRYQDLQEKLLGQPKVWLITGVAGFIGSNLLETLLRLNQRVIGLDSYVTGSRHNLEQVQNLVGPEQWNNFLRIDGDIRDLDTCKRVSLGVDYVLHQAALSSVPGSIANPDDTHAHNVSGFLNVLIAAREKRVKRVIYASSSSVYGDHPALPKVEAHIGRSLSPYAASKRVNELYADVFARCYGVETIGLRYFNVFGARQDPNGPYAAVIPKWIAALIRNEPAHINGDGDTSHDFCYVSNAVQANLLAATTENTDAINEVYNVAISARTTLNELFRLLRKRLLPWHPHLKRYRPVYQDSRLGEVRHSEADTSKARRLLGYQPTHTVEQGISEALEWYRQNLGPMPVREERAQRRRRVNASPVPSGMVAAVASPTIFPQQFSTK